MESRGHCKYGSSKARSSCERGCADSAAVKPINFTMFSIGGLVASGCRSELTTNPGKFWFCWENQEINWTGVTYDARSRPTTTDKSWLPPANDCLRDLAMSKSRNWTGTANDRYGEIGSISSCPATVSSRCTAGVCRAPLLTFIQSANFSEICSTPHADARGLLSLERVVGFRLERWLGLHWNAWLYSLENAH